MPADIIDEGSGGGATTVINNIDIDSLVKVLQGDSLSILKDTAMRLFANTNFDMESGKSIIQIAEEAISKATIFTIELKKAEEKLKDLE